MPTYVYEVVKPDGSAVPGSRFEHSQSMKEEPLQAHPKTGEPVRRVIQSVSVLGGTGPGGSPGQKPQGGCGHGCGCHR